MNHPQLTNSIVNNSNNSNDKESVTSFNSNQPQQKKKNKSNFNQNRSNHQNSLNDNHQINLNSNSFQRNAKFRGRRNRNAHRSNENYFELRNYNHFDRSDRKHFDEKFERFTRHNQFNRFEAPRTFFNKHHFYKQNGGVEKLDKHLEPLDDLLKSNDKLDKSNYYEKQQFLRKQHLIRQHQLQQLQQQQQMQQQNKLDLPNVDNSTNQINNHQINLNQEQFNQRFDKSNLNSINQFNTITHQQIGLPPHSIPNLNGQFNHQLKQPDQQLNNAILFTNSSINGSSLPISLSRSSLSNTSLNRSVLSSNSLNSSSNQSNNQQFAINGLINGLNKSNDKHDDKSADGSINKSLNSSINRSIDTNRPIKITKSLNRLPAVGKENVPTESNQFNQIVINGFCPNDLIPIINSQKLINKEPTNCDQLQPNPNILNCQNIITFAANLQNNNLMMSNNSAKLSHLHKQQKLHQKQRQQQNINDDQLANKVNRVSISDAESNHSSSNTLGKENIGVSANNQQQTTTDKNRSNENEANKSQDKNFSVENNKLNNVVKDQIQNDLVTQSTAIVQSNKSVKPSTSIVGTNISTKQSTCKLNASTQTTFTTPLVQPITTNITSTIAPIVPEATDNKEATNGMIQTEKEAGKKTNTFNQLNKEQQIQHHQHPCYKYPKREFVNNSEFKKHKYHKFNKHENHHNNSNKVKNINGINNVQINQQQVVQSNSVSSADGFNLKATNYVKLLHNTTDIVSTQMWKLFLLQRQTPLFYDHKVQVRNLIYENIKRLFEHELIIVGSSLNGLGTITSDVDMCLLLPKEAGEIDQLTQAIPILNFVKDHLEKQEFVESVKVIEAKVPILKLVDKKYHIEVDLNVNNIVGIRNTQLIRTYAELDWRMRPLAITIKAWASRNHINDAHKKTMSSYTLVLMLIHYLQTCPKPVLPCLHKLMPLHFQNDTDVKELELILKKVPEFKTENKQPIGELLLGFLYYYGYEFNYESDVISIRQGTVMNKETAKEFRSSKNNTWQWRYICCEEPFDRTNTARSVIDYQSFNFILTVFRTSYQSLKQHNNLLSILRINIDQLINPNPSSHQLTNASHQIYQKSNQLNHHNQNQQHQNSNQQHSNQQHSNQPHPNQQHSNQHSNQQHSNQHSNQQHPNQQQSRQITTTTPHNSVRFDRELNNLINEGINRQIRRQKSHSSSRSNSLSSDDNKPSQSK